MKKEKRLAWAAVMLLLFLLWTLAVIHLDVQPIGPRDSSVGLASLNGAVHRLTGTHMGLYVLTDWLGLVPVACILGFALLGLVQWIRRKSLRDVDRSILLLGAFYIAVMAVYLFFEYWVVNYRPVLINGFLEASYPSSTTLLVLCVMPTAIMQLRERIHRSWLRTAAIWLICGFMAFMVISRLISGVHWVTDIIGGALLSAGLVLLYAGTVKFAETK